MDILSTIEQESAVLASEKWKKRPQIVLLQEEEPNLVTKEGTVIQYTAICAMTKAGFYHFVISSALECGGDVLMIDLDSSVKMGYLLESFSVTELKDRVHIYKAYNWQSFNTLFNLIPQLMFEHPDVAAVIVNGLNNPYFYFQKRKSDKKVISKDNFAYQQLANINQAFRLYNIPVFVPNMASASENSNMDQPRWPSFVTAQLNFVKSSRDSGDNCVVMMRKNPNDQVREINCISKQRLLQNSK